LAKIRAKIEPDIYEYFYGDQYRHESSESFENILMFKKRKGGSCKR
jgi:hypothetical protein